VERFSPWDFKSDEKETMKPYLLSVVVGTLFGLVGGVAGLVLGSAVKIHYAVDAKGDWWGVAGGPLTLRLMMFLALVGFVYGFLSTLKRRRARPPG